MTDREQIARWNEDIRLGNDWRFLTSGQDDTKWATYIDHYRGDWVLDGRFNDFIPANRVFPYVRSTIPSIYMKNPGIYIPEGKTLGNFNDRGVLKTYIDYLLRVLRIKSTMKRIVFDTLCYGIGVIKVGFGSEFTSGKPEIKNRREESLQYNEYIKSGLPWAINIDPRDIVFPYGTRVVEESRWVAQEIIRPYADAKEDSMLANRDKLKPQSFTVRKKRGRFRKEEFSSLSSKNLEVVKFWEIHDKKTSESMLISDGCDKFHYKERAIKNSGFPYHILTYDPDPESIWPVSAIGIIEPQQLELNRIKSLLHAHWKRECTKFLIGAQAVPPGEEGDAAIAAINDATIPQAAIRVMKPDDIKIIMSNAPPDLLAAVREIDNDIRFQIGFNRLTTGESTTGRHTAHEIAAMQQAIELRNNERRDLTVDIFERVVHDLFELSFNYMSDEDVKKINKGLSWNPRDSEPGYVLEINPEEAVPTTTETRKAEALLLLDKLQASPLVNPLSILANFFQSYGYKPEDFIDPEIAQTVISVLTSRQQQQKGGGDA